MRNKLLLAGNFTTIMSAWTIFMNHPFLFHKKKISQLERAQAYSYVIMENTGVVLLVQVYWPHLRLSPWTLPQGDKTWSISLAWWKSIYTKTFESKVNTCCFWNVILLSYTSTTRDCSFLKTLLFLGWNAFLCHASISSLLLCRIRTNLIFAWSSTWISWQEKLY